MTEKEGSKHVLWKVLFSIPVLALFGLYLNYKTTGAEDLRTKAYQPLFAELAGVRQSLEGGTSTEIFDSKALQALQKSGDIERIPPSLRNKVIATYKEANDVQSSITSITELVQRHISVRIAKLRTAQLDQKWRLQATKRLEGLAKQQGWSPIRSQTFHHAGRGIVWDVRDVNNPKVAGPGGPTWQLKDWAGYPDSITDIEPYWTENEYIFFDDTLENWYYKITQDDLKRNGITLADFLRPTYEALAQQQEFKRYVADRPLTIEHIKKLQAEIGDRVRDPKRLSDIFD